MIISNLQLPKRQNPLKCDDPNLPQIVLRYLLKCDDLQQFLTAILCRLDEILCRLDEILCRLDEILCRLDEILCRLDEILCRLDEILCRLDEICMSS